VIRGGSRFTATAAAGGATAACGAPLVVIIGNDWWPRLWLYAAELSAFTTKGKKKTETGMIVCYRTARDSPSSSDAQISSSATKMHSAAASAMALWIRKKLFLTCAIFSIFHIIAPKTTFLRNWTSSSASKSVDLNSEKRLSRISTKFANKTLLPPQLLDAHKEHTARNASLRDRREPLPKRWTETKTKEKKKFFQSPLPRIHGDPGPWSI